MGIHLPITLKSQAEARILMLSINNLTLASTGEPNVHPNQEIILGSYYLTNETTNLTYLFKKIIRLKDK